MNILPKKRWHVRTKDNIARVRKDEAEAREIEKNRLGKLAFAESEARINFLRSKSGSTSSAQISSISNECQDSQAGHIETTNSDSCKLQHVDLFQDYQSFIKKTNDGHRKEKKEEQEKYEKQIGYLTYLGQDTNEALKLRSWYEIAPKRNDFESDSIVEKDLKGKYYNDPLNLIKTLLPPQKPPTAKPTTVSKPVIPKCETFEKYKKKSKEKKHKRKDRERVKQEEQERKREIIEKLRMDRLKREAREKARQDELLNPKSKQPEEQKIQENTPRITQKYNSQFNPGIAKQNLN